MNPIFLLRTLATAALLLLLGACSVTKSFEQRFPDQREVDYKTSRTVPSLEVPPDLTAPSRDNTMDIGDGSGDTTYSAYSSGRQSATAGTGSRVLPKTPGVRLVRSGDKAWLVIQGTPEQVWNRVHEYWLRQGYVLKVDNPTLGIMETDWMENRADIPKDAITGFLSSIAEGLYSPGTLDRYRIRLEAGDEPGTTELYLTHQGMREVREGTGIEQTGTYWEPRPSDPELEMEMLKRIMVYLGVEEQKARRMLASKTPRPPRARLVQDAQGLPELLVTEDFSRTWRYTGLALDRVGFAVEDRDRSKGVYFVRYNDPEAGKKKKGFFSSLAFWSRDKKPEARTFQIQIRSENNTSRIRVLDEKGARDTSDTAKRILTLLQEQLK